MLLGNLKLCTREINSTANARNLKKGEIKKFLYEHVW